MQIPGYEILEEINRGQISTVYLGRQKSRNRDVVIKQLNPQWSNESDLIERFRREATISAKLDHPNIVNIIDVSTDTKHLHIVLEYISGLDLAKFIKQYPLVPVPIILDITKQLLEGLSYAHQHRILHRDLKPSNIIVGVDGSVKITDFGLAKDWEMPGISMQGEIIGTAAYMSPEQARGGKVDVRSDIFSLGITLFELSSGQNSPFHGESLVDSIQKLMQESLPSLGSIRTDIPAWYSELISKMLDKKAENRPGSIEEILALPGFQEKAPPQTLSQFIQSGKNIKPVRSKRSSQNRNLVFLTTFLISSILAVLVMMNVGQVTPEPELSLASAIPTDSLGIVINTADSTIDSSVTSSEKNLNNQIVRKEDTIPQPKTESRNSPASDKTILPIPDTLVSAVSDSSPIEPAFIKTIDTTDIRPSISNASLFVICIPWADIFINGEKVETTPLQSPITLPAGEHELMLKNPNFSTYRRKIVLDSGKIDTLTHRFQAENGLLDIQVTPWADIFINQRYKDTTPLEKPIKLPEGKYWIELVNTGYQTWSDSVSIVAGAELVKKVILEKRP